MVDYPHVLVFWSAPEFKEIDLEADLETHAGLCSNTAALGQPGVQNEEINPRHKRNYWSKC